MTIIIPVRPPDDVDDREFDIGQRVRGTTLAKWADAANQLCFNDSLWSFNVQFLRDYDRTSLLKGAGDPSMNIASKTIDTTIGQTGLPVLTTTINTTGLPLTTQTHIIDLPDKSKAASTIGFILTYIAPGTPYSELTYQGSGTSYERITNLESRIRMRLLERTGVNTFSYEDPTSSSYWAVDLNADDNTLPANRLLHDEDVFVNVVSGNSVLKQLNDDFRGKSFRVLRTAGTSDLGHGNSAPKTPRLLHYGNSNATGSYAIEISYLAAQPIELFLFEVPKVSV